MRTSTIDLFCGIGGLSYGLKEAGLEIDAGIDLDSSCKFAYETNINSHFLTKDISTVTGDDLRNYWKKGSISILVGCAPCQPFSTHSNKLKDKHKSNKWFLLSEFKRLIIESNPIIISMENVPNLANQDIFEEFVAALQSLNYHVSFSNVYCPDYGIPQKRRRLVLLASLLGDIKLISPTHSKENYVSIKQVIQSLPEIKAGEQDKTDPLHICRALSPINLKRIKASKPNGTWLDWDESLKLNCHKKKSGKSYKSVYGRMSWNEPSPTITTQFYNFGTGRFGHPEQDRALSIREGALLQTFPVDYQFFKDPQEISTTTLGVHIGNAVPVKLGQVIGNSILNHLGEFTNE